MTWQEGVTVGDSIAPRSSVAVTRRVLLSFLSSTLARIGHRKPTMPPRGVPRDQNNLPEGYAEYLMQQRVTGVSFKDMAPILEKKYADHIAALAKDGRQLNRGFWSGLRRLIRRGAALIRRLSHENGHLGRHAAQLRGD